MNIGYLIDECEALNIENYILKSYYSRDQDGYGG
jgi:hypothetical protein